MKLHNVVGNSFKGAGGVFDFFMLKNEFRCVSDRGHGGLSDAFYRIKKYCSCPELSGLKIWILHAITVRSRALTAIYSKS